MEISNGQGVPPRRNPPTNPTGSKGTTNIFFKTRMCTKFLEGCCKNGASCNFAHGSDDLREPPSNWQAIVREGGSKSWKDDQRIYKMKICRRFYNGEECPYGQSCNFIHERPNKNIVDSSDECSRVNVTNLYQRESAIIRIGTPTEDEKSKDPNQNLDATLMKNAYWKTKMCSTWEITGQCPFGGTCHFAHGHSELHVPSVPIEADFSAIQVKPSMVPVIDPSPSIDIDAQTKVVGEDKKFPRWKPKKKINTIYGDWLDDLTPFHVSPNEVEDE